MTNELLLLFFIIFVLLISFTYDNGRMGLPPTFLARKDAVKSICLVDGLSKGSPENKVGGLGGGTRIWLSANYKKYVYNSFFHELYHSIDSNDNDVNPDPADRSWRALNRKGFKYLHER